MKNIFTDFIHINCHENRYKLSKVNAKNFQIHNNKWAINFQNLQEISNFKFENFPIRFHYLIRNLKKNKLPN